MADVLRILWAALLFLADYIYRRFGGREPAPMLATVVPRLWTPIVYADLPEALASAHEAHFGYALWPTSLPVVVAMMRLEHGPLTNGILHGCANWNLGNFDATSEELADPAAKIFTTVPEHEVIAGKSAQQVHTRVASADLDAGALRWWAVMAVRFGAAVDVLHGMLPGGKRIADDAPVKTVADLFCEQLKSAGYFTSSLVTYEAAVEHFAALAAAA